MNQPAKAAFACLVSHSSLQYKEEYCFLLFAPIHRKIRSLRVHSNLKRRAECFIVKRLPALRIPRDKQTQMSVFALTVQGAMSLRLVRKIAADARQSPQAIQRRITKGFNTAGVAILPALNQVQAISTRLTLTPRLYHGFFICKMIIYHICHI